MNEVEYKIVPKDGKYDVYIGDKFQCSKNTMIEAVDELERLMFRDGD